MAAIAKKVANNEIASSKAPHETRKAAQQEL